MNKSILAIAGLLLSSQLHAEPSKEFPAFKICKAAIATIMGRDPKIIKVKPISSDEFSLSYKRPSDDTLWGFGCKLVASNQILWRSGAEPENPNYIGRWRTHPDDGEVTYSIAAGQLTINDSMGSTKVFTKEEL